MVHVDPQQGASYPEAEPPATETRNEPQIQPKEDAKRSFIGGFSRGGGRIGVIALVGAIGVVLMIVLIRSAPKPRTLGNVGPQQSQQRAAQETGSLPTDNSRTQQLGIASDGDTMTAAKIQQSAQLGSHHPQVTPLVDNQSTGHGAPRNNEKLGQVPPLTPPPIPGSGNAPWTPAPYNGAAASSTYAETMKAIALARHAALTASSMTYVSQPLSQVSLSDQQTGKAQETQGAINNLGYQPGYHIATHLETVASTAVQAPVIAVVDFDYQRNGRTIVPAGSRLIGTMGASNETGIVNLHFTSIRMPNGNTAPVSAVGLNHQLQALKGVVTGKHVVEQFLMAGLAGAGSSAAVFAGNNVNGQLTEADILRTQAASNIGSNIDSQISTLQQSVPQKLVVTLPAGTEVEAMFTSAERSQTLTSAITGLTNPQEQSK